jgi:hypothetical protein
MNPAIISPDYHKNSKEQKHPEQHLLGSFAYTEIERKNTEAVQGMGNRKHQQD